MPLDDHSREQHLNLTHYHLEAKHAPDAAHDPWSAVGPRSVAPFVPCASSRIPMVLHAARLGPEDVLWDLGCGDGRLLHQAAVQYGCRCVGLDIDAPCITEAAERASEQGVASLCQFLCCDLLALQPDSLRTGVLGEAAAADAPAMPPPTCAIVFLTGHGLARLAPLLYGEWCGGGLRLVTCVEALDSTFDFEEGAAGLFEEREQEWPIDRTHERHGIFVVPPLGVAPAAWSTTAAASRDAAVDAPPSTSTTAAAGGTDMGACCDPRPKLTPAQADLSEHVVLRGLLSDEEIGRLCARGEGALGSQAEEAPVTLDLFDEAGAAATMAEDYFHNSSDNCEHRVAHLHRGGALQREESRLLERVLSHVRRADAARWRLLLGRPACLRSAEYHAYTNGGSVADPEHRDQGSLLTLTVLLSEPTECQRGGELRVATSSDRDEAAFAPVTLARGDGCLFVSERRHNVTPVVGGRRSFVIELWDGPPTEFNRHR